MRLVLNANILFAALIKDASTRALLANKRIDLYAPGVLLFEEQKYRQLLAAKGEFSTEQLDALLARLISRVRIVEPTVTTLRQAAAFSLDPDDIAYLALCLQLRCPLWSNDGRLAKQRVVAVLSTTDVLALSRRTQRNV